MKNKIISYKQDIELFKMYPFLKKYKRKWFTNRILLDVVDIAAAAIGIPFFILQLPFIIIGTLAATIVTVINSFYKIILTVFGLSVIHNNLKHNEKNISSEVASDVKKHNKNRMDRKNKKGDNTTP